MNNEEANKCSKCGLCLPRCPVYNEVADESISPRAKVQLIKRYVSGRLDSSENLSSIISECLMCGSCKASCPSGVLHDKLFMTMRSQMVEDFGEHWQMKIVYHLLKEEKQLDIAIKIAKWGRDTVLWGLLKDVKLGNIPLKRMPLINSQPFRSQVQDISQPKSYPKGTLLYFTGCGTNYVYSNVGRSVLHVLNQMGYAVEIPKKQVCCGLPMFFHGNFEKAKNNILQNIALFNRPEIDAVVVDCATCGAALKKEWIAVLEYMGLDAESANDLSGKVKDISEFIFEHMEDLTPLLRKRQEPQKVTYHSPCHLKNEQNIQSQVEQLLEALPGFSYQRSVDFDSCCGGGGTFFMDFPEISKAIVDKKIANAASTGAKLLVTGCPGCMFNISGNIKKDENLTVLHPVELVSSQIQAD